MMVTVNETKMYSTYPVDAVGVANSWDGFVLRVCGQDWSRTES